MNDPSTAPTDPPVRLPGAYLLIAGSALHFRANHLMKHLPGALTQCVETLDVVGAVSAYNGPSKSRAARLLLGLWNICKKRTFISSMGDARIIDGSRLHLPTILHWMIQDVWLYLVSRKALRPKYKVVIAGGPDSVIFAWLLKRFGRTKHIVYYDYDYFPFVHDYRGVKRIVRHMVDWRERLGVRMADEVISVSRPLIELRNGQGAKRVTLIPNGVETDRFSVPRTEPGSTRPPTIIYTGTIDNRWGIDLAVAAMPTILEKMPETRLVIVGEGLDEGNLKQQAEDLKVSAAVDFLGKRPYEELPGLLAKADIGVASSRPDIFRLYASPLKLIEYMAAGLAIICSGGGEAEMMVEESGAGVNIEFSPVEFANAAVNLMSDAGALSRHCTCGIDYASGRSWHSVSQKLAEVLTRVSSPA